MHFITSKYESQPQPVSNKRSIHSSYGRSSNSNQTTPNTQSVQAVTFARQNSNSKIRKFDTNSQDSQQWKAQQVYSQNMGSEEHYKIDYSIHTRKDHVQSEPPTQKKSPPEKLNSGVGDNKNIMYAHLNPSQSEVMQLEASAR